MRDNTEAEYELFEAVKRIEETLTEIKSVLLEMNERQKLNSAPFKIYDFRLDDKPTHERKVTVTSETP